MVRRLLSYHQVDGRKFREPRGVRISKISSRRVSPILTLWASLFALHSVHAMRVCRLMEDWL
jgi:hypothetical protein